MCQVQEMREVMEAEMRTQLRRQAAAHTDHLRDVLKVQEQELREEAQEVPTLPVHVDSHLHVIHDRI